MDINEDLITQLQSENEQLKLGIIAAQAQIDALKAELAALPIMATMQQINTLAAQIGKLSQVQ